MVNAFKWRIQGNTYAYWTDVNGGDFIITDQYDIADEAKVSDFVSKVEREAEYEKQYNRMAAQVKAQFNMDMLPYTYYFNMSGDYCGVGDDRLAYKGVGIYEIEAEKGVVDGVTGTTVTIHLDDSARTSTPFFVADGKDADVDDINEEIAELNGKVSTNTDSIIYLSGITDSLSGQIQSIINWQEGANSVISTSVGDINQWAAMTQSLSGYVYSDLQQEIGIMDDGIAGVNQKITQLSGNTTAVTQNINQQISTANSEISRVEKLSYVDGIVDGTPVTAVTNTLEANYSQVQQQADRIETTVSNFKIGNENLVRRTSNSNKEWVFEDDVWTLRFHRENGLYEDYKDALSGTTDRVYVFDEYFNESNPSIKCGVKGLRINVRNEDSAHTLNPPLPVGIEQYPIGQDGSQVITGGIDEYPETRYIDFTQELYSEYLISATTVVTPFLKSNTDYVLSFYARSDQSQEGYIYTFITGADNEGDIIKTLEYERLGTLVNTESSALTDNAHGWLLHWNSKNQDKYHRYTYSFTTGANTSTQSKLIFRIPRGTIYSIGQVQLEEGNTVSTWGESSMDVDKKFSKIEQTDENISLTVADTLNQSGIDIFSGKIGINSPKLEISSQLNVINGGNVTVFDDEDNVSVILSSNNIETSKLMDLSKSEQTITKGYIQYDGIPKNSSELLTSGTSMTIRQEVNLGTINNGEVITVSVDEIYFDGMLLYEEILEGDIYRDVSWLVKNSITASTLEVNVILAYSVETTTTRQILVHQNGGSLVKNFYYKENGNECVTLRKTKYGAPSDIYGKKYSGGTITLTATNSASNAKLIIEYTVGFDKGSSKGLVYYQSTANVKVTGNAKSITVIGHNGMYSYTKEGNSAFYFGDNAIMFKQGRTGLIFSGGTETPGGRLGTLTYGKDNEPHWLPFYNYTPLFNVVSAETYIDKTMCGICNTIENGIDSDDLWFKLPDISNSINSDIPLGYSLTIIFGNAAAQGIHIIRSGGDDTFYYKGGTEETTNGVIVDSGSGRIIITLVKRTEDPNMHGVWLVEVLKNDA